jgi:hypothetical protein
LVALAAVVLANSGPSGPPDLPPMVIQESSEPPPTPLPALVVPFEDDSGFVPPDAWPSACDLLTDAEIQAVLPQVDVIRRRGEDREFDVFSTFERFTVVDASCRYELDIPDAGVGFETAGLPPTIRVELGVVGLPDVVDQNDHPRGEVVAVPEGECSGDVFSTECRDDGIVFEVAFDAAHPEVDDEAEDGVEVGLARRVLAKVPTPTRALPTPAPP